MPTPRRLLPVAAGILALVAACGGGSTPSATPASPSASTGASGSPSAGVVAIEASEYKFDPATLSVPAGEVTFSVTNVGSVEHEFEIFRDANVVDEIEGIVPGITLELTANLPAGEYTDGCKLAGHEEQGMKGTLTVTG